MNYYGGKNLPAKLRSRRRKAAKCKSLGLNAQSLSVCINKAELIKNVLLAKRAEKSVKPARAALKVKNAEVKPEVKPAEAKPEVKEAKTKKVAPQKAEVKEAKAKKTETPKSEVKEAKAKKAEDKKPKAEEVIEATPAEDVKPTEVVEPAADVAEVKTESVEPVAEIKVESVETEEKTQSPAEVVAEKITEQTAENSTETKAGVAPESATETLTENSTETATETPIENTAEEQTEESTEKIPEKTEGKTEEKTKLDPTENAELLSKIATKRARKLIYAPKEAIYEVTGIKIEVDGKKNDKGVKVKDILEAEIKEGLKLGYLDKYDGLKTSEIKEEYENDTVWEIAEQEFKKMGLLLDGDKIKVYVFDWTGTGCHHVGYIPDDKAAELIPYLADMDKYSFDLDGIITGGKSKTVTKDPKTGKITITKGKDGGYGIDLDVTIINRKD